MYRVQRCRGGGRYLVLQCIVTLPSWNSSDTGICESFRRVKARQCFKSSPICLQILQVSSAFEHCPGWLQLPIEVALLTLRAFLLCLLWTFLTYEYQAAQNMASMCSFVNMHTWMREEHCANHSNHLRLSRGHHALERPIFSPFPLALLTVALMLSIH